MCRLQFASLPQAHAPAAAQILHTVSTRVSRGRTGAQAWLHELMQDLNTPFTAEPGGPGLASTDIQTAEQRSEKWDYAPTGPAPGPFPVALQTIVV